MNIPETSSNAYQAAQMANTASGSNWFQRTFDPNGTNNAFNAAQAYASNWFNEQESQKNRDFQERMSNTAYQRAVEDMKSAGLNPYLAYGQGGASTPSGSMGSGYSASASGSSNFQVIDSVIGLATSAVRLGLDFGVGR